MRLIPKKLAGHYKTAHRAGLRHVKRRPYILPLFGLLLGLLIVGLIFLGKGGHTYIETNYHVVYLFDSGQKRTIDTKAQTVGELIGKLNLHLIPQDVVEPSLNTPIVEDNFRVNIYHARPVTVIDGDHKVVTLTAQLSARVAAETAGLKIRPEDIASFSTGEIKDNVIGEQVVVRRATPITINLYGSQVPTYTLATTVGGLLSEKHVTLDNGESVSPSLSTPIKPKMVVFVLSKGSHVQTAEETIPVPTKVINDASLSFGTTVTRQQGSEGKQLTTYLISGQKGKLPTKKIIQRIIIEPPVPKIVARGTTIDINGDKTSIMADAGISSGDYAYANFIISHESGWRVTAANPSGAYGLCQALPGSKMATAGGDWATNPITQLRWCSGYASRSYGGWANAYYHWLNYSSW